MLTKNTREQLLAVIRRFMEHYNKGVRSHEAFWDAVRETAREYHVEYQTIGDIFGRRLGQTSDDAKRQLERAVRGDPSDLLSRLNVYTPPSFQQVIIKTIEGSQIPETSQKAPQKLSDYQIKYELDETRAKKLYVLSQLTDISQDILLGELVDERFRQQMEKLL